MADAKAEPAAQNAPAAAAPAAVAADPAAPAPAAVPSAAAASTAGWDGVSLDAWPDLRLAAEAQLGETEARKAHAVPGLREMLNALPEEKRPRDLSDAALLRALRVRKFRVDDTFNLLVASRAFELKHPAWFTDLKGEEFRELYKSGFMRVLRGRDRVGRRVSLLLPMRFPDTLDANLLMRWNMWSLGRLGRCPHFQVFGASIYENFEVFSLMQSMKLNASMPPNIMRANFQYLQKCAAYRLGGIWVLNQPRFMSILWALVRPFMSAKLKQRVRFLGTDVDAFTKEMDPALLPPEFGGTLDEDPMAWLDEQIALEKAGQ